MVLLYLLPVGIITQLPLHTFEDSAFLGYEAVYLHSSFPTLRKEIFLWNLRIQLPAGTASYTRTTVSSISPPWEAKGSQNCNCLSVLIYVKFVSHVTWEVGNDYEYITKTQAGWSQFFSPSTLFGFLSASSCIWPHQIIPKFLHKFSWSLNVTVFKNLLIYSCVCLKSDGQRGRFTLHEGLL
jgi:hypothetical protein